MAKSTTTRQSNGTRTHAAVGGCKFELVTLVSGDYPEVYEIDSTGLAGFLGYANEVSRETYDLLSSVIRNHCEYHTGFYGIL